MYKVIDGQWKCVDGGYSALIIFHDDASSLGSRLIAFSLSHEASTYLTN